MHTEIISTCRVWCCNCHLGKVFNVEQRELEQGTWDSRLTPSKPFGEWLGTLIQAARRPSFNNLWAGQPLFNSLRRADQLHWGCPAGERQRETPKKMGNHYERSGHLTTCQAQGQAFQLSRNTFWNPKMRRTSQQGLRSILQAIQWWDSKKFLSLKSTFMFTATPEKSQVITKRKHSNYTMWRHYPMYVHCITLGQRMNGRKTEMWGGVFSKVEI